MQTKVTYPHNHVAMDQSVSIHSVISVYILRVVSLIKGTGNIFD